MVLLLLCLFPLPVQGEQADLQAIYEEQYDASGAEGLVPLVPEEAGDLLKELDITPENAVFLDDNAKNTKAAREFGLHAITVENKEQTDRDLHALGVTW